LIRDIRNDDGITRDRSKQGGWRVVRAAVWQTLLGLGALACLVTQRSAAQSAPPDITSFAPVASSDESRLALTAADGANEPPAEAVPSAEPGAEAVPPGEVQPDSAGATPQGTPLPNIEDVLGENQPCTPVVSSNCWFAPDHWYFNADFVVLSKQPSKRNPTLAQDITIVSPTQAILGQTFGQQDLDLGIIETGRFTLGVWRCHDSYGWDHAIEFSFLGLANWHKGFNLPGTISTDGISPGGSAFMYYKSQFNSGGIDLRWTKRAGSKDELVYDPDGYWKRQAESGFIFTFLLGVHDTELDEKFDFLIASAAGSNLAFHDKTTNNLLGLHVGTELDYKHDLWYLGVRGGGTPSVNFAEYNANLVVNAANNPTLPSPRIDNTVINTPGCVSEFGLVAGWQIRPNMRVRASYDFTWLTTVALAPSQFKLGNLTPPAINVTNDQMLTDMSLGLEINW
jgi:hypothetical protein